MSDKTKNNISLSQAFKELEEITQQMENEEVDLEKGIPKFKRGLQLARFLKEKLTKIENEIEEIKAEFKDLPKERMPETEEEPGVEENEETKLNNSPF